MPTWLANLPIIDSPLPVILDLVVVLAVAALVLPARGARSRTWYRRVAIAAGIGALAGTLVGWLTSDVFDAFGVSLTWVSRGWVAAAGAAAGVAVASMYRVRWPRVLAATVVLVLIVLTGANGINIDFGQYQTVGDTLGVTTFVKNALPAPRPQAAIGAIATWAPPRGLREHGSVSLVTIPGVVSHFHARQALVYLPPAALVPNPPKLPVVIALPGQPGRPDQVFHAGKLAQFFDAFAAKHHGLAPIVVAPDQLGNPNSNPMCVDGPLGNVRTYLTVDVVDWIHRYLNVTEDRRGWVITGFSEGGTCSIQLAAAYPEIFGSFIDVAGERVPAVGSPANTIKVGFRGNAAAYRAASPAAELAAHAPYSDSVAILVAGEDDHRYRGREVILSKLTKAAGMTTHNWVAPGSAHDWATVRYGWERGFALLAGRMGL